MCSILYSSAARFAARTKHLNVWHEHGRSNVTVHLGRQQCARMPSLLSPWHAHTLLVPANIRATTRRYRKVRHTLYYIVRQLCYPSKVSPPIVVKLAFSLRRHIRKTLAIIQSESTTHGTSLPSNGSSVDAAGGKE